jgi:two-component system chemotaxis sensor kinase CheA
MSTSLTNEYAHFRKTFFDECAEILADMEACVAGLHSGGAARDDLHAIFRAVHSIKAGAGAFGFDELVEFSHIFEALLDQMRDGHIPADERICTTLIRASDILSALVAAAQEERPIENGYGSDVAEELRAILEAATGMAAGGAAAKTEAAAAEAAQHDYRIGFRPFAELFRHANEPLLLIRELKRLGTLTVRCDQTRLPRLGALEPEESYLAWTFELKTARGKADIAEVFEFVDQDCELTIEELARDEPEPAAAASSEAGASSTETASPDKTAGRKDGSGNAGQGSTPARSAAS